jgi:peptide/nickel transport system substrate-binding protein
MLTPKDSLRIQKYRDMDAMAIKQHPIIPLYYDEVVRFIQKGVNGMEINPINLLVLKNVNKE